MYCQQINDDDDADIGIFHKIHVKNQASLIAFCKQKARDTHRVKSEDVKRQTAKRFSKKKDAAEVQLMTSLNTFKGASWLHQQYRSPRFWKTPKKAMDEFAKINAVTNQKKFVKEQIHIVYLGLGLKEAYHPWSRDGYEFTAVELLEHFVKVCLPLTKTRKLPNDAPIEHPRLPDFPTLGTLSLDVANYYTEQTKSENELRLKALREREKEVLMGIWDGAEYMNEVNWPEKSLKTGYKIEMCFSYPDAEEESRIMWCCGDVTRVKKRDDKVIKVNIKWDKEFVAVGESEEDEQLLKKNCGIPRLHGRGPGGRICESS